MTVVNAGDPFENIIPVLSLLSCRSLGQVVIERVLFLIDVNRSYLVGNIGTLLLPALVRASLGQVHVRLHCVMHVRMFLKLPLTRLVYSIKLG